jgi:hypothetical protein
METTLNDTCFSVAYDTRTTLVFKYKTGLTQGCSRTVVLQPAVFTALLYLHILNL